ncbi:MAG: MFS transporter [Bacillota bacterium]|nr:MFS transporter [Bacillota bacterium]
MSRRGKWKWVILILLIIPFIFAQFHRFALAVIADELMMDFGITATSFGVLSAMYFYIYALMQLPTGIMVDTIGPKRVVVYSMLVAAFGTGLFAMTDIFALALLGRMLLGAGVATIWVANLKFLADWFDQRLYAFMVGVIGFVGTMGMVLAGSPFASFAEIWSWRFGFGIIAALSLLIAVICWLMIPEKRDLGETNMVSGKSGEGNNWQFIKIGMKSVASNKLSWFPFVIFFGVYGSYATFVGMWGLPFLQQVTGWERQAVAGFTTMSAVGFMFGLPVIGLISDKLLGKRRLVMIWGTWMVLLLWMSTFLITFKIISVVSVPKTVFYILFFLVGFFSSSSMISMSVAKEVNKPDLAGMAIGLTNSGGFVSVAIWQPVIGLFLDLSWKEQISVAGTRIYPSETYLMVSALTILLVLMGLVASYFMVETNCKNITYNE